MKLRECPFCKNKHCRVNHTDVSSCLRYIYVECIICKARGPSLLFNTNGDWEKVETKVMKEWNNRGENYEAMD